MLDAILVVLIIVFAISGYRQGFIVGVLSFVGFIGGGVLAALGAPPVIQAFVPNPTQQALIAIAMVFLFAALGQFFTSYLGALIRNRVTWNSARILDAMGGALVSTLSVLLVSWLVGSAVANSMIPLVTEQVQNSRILRTVDRVMPDPAQTWFSTFRRIVDQSAFPQVFSGLGTSEPAEVAEPDPSVLNTEELRRASQSVVKVLGNAPSCQRRVEGTGFVYAHERVMTNAHVVAGVEEELRIVTRDGTQYEAIVVLYDPQQDLAVLAVPGLDLEPLEFEMQAKKGDDAVVAGFPRDSGFTVVPARIRAEQTARGPDFYHSQQVSREIYQVRAVIQPGNSGGPLLSPRGTVYGVVFAAATNDEETGYVLTAEEVAANAEAGIRATTPVSTQECD
ncbi:MarP family serine protease [Thermobifida fusca]|uniref:Serine protease n=1 Tax=Thermobifida fusca TM51 TaxID=1169414 RepID=A0A9P2TCF7_THEFU|nr:MULTISPECIES: MarP family serine protease [Thermobifida]EOR72761.1 serine protease [Thermobifida fusca TM51]MBO2528750.1 serine protease [Thermobifida sp.]PPS92398.1 serine protease [Thermobifida fusca]PZN66647.1 MAG: serine protease [Thermobifida fusca]QOS59726.1 MarP family serine protease [Thermobifida fusca]